MGGVGRSCCREWFWSEAIGGLLFGGGRGWIWHGLRFFGFAFFPGIVGVLCFCLPACFKEDGGLDLFGNCDALSYGGDMTGYEFLDWLCVWCRSSKMAHVVCVELSEGCAKVSDGRGELVGYGVGGVGIGEARQDGSIGVFVVCGLFSSLASFAFAFTCGLR